jgi:sortase A
MWKKQKRIEEQEAEEQQLLQRLLLAPVPDEHSSSRPTVGRPVALRSTQEYRRFALRSFLQRTWFDHTLYHVERLLTAIVLIVFGLWLANSYGYDWAYRLLNPPVNHTSSLAVGQTTHAPSPHSATLPISHTAHYTRATPGNQPAAALPYTQPHGRRGPPAIGAEGRQAARNTLETPNYLIPQQVDIAPEVADQRPFFIRIPAIEVESSVEEVFIEGEQWQVADYAVGYHHGTALPGDGGNTVMAGHAGLRGAVFRDLDDVQVDDDIFVDAGEWHYHYRVRAIRRVWPTQVEVMNPSPTPILTLITCTEWDTKRLVVIADLVGSVPR